MSEPSNGPAETPTIADLPADERERLLAVERRWLALDVLGGQTTPVELRELAAGIAAREDGSDAVDEQAIERVAITLHHTHLPKLADAGVLDYDPESHRIDPEGVPTRLATDPPSPGSVDWLSVFVDQHRRLLLEVLARTERTTLEGLSTTLASEDTDAVDASAETIATRLHHDHLPRLDDLGVVDYDPDTHVVEVTEAEYRPDR